ncbi:hypothetical protein CKM354_000424300 [Cercospora kikuchii]|uniref:Uncharacterized protein n=1 Tax=Cercospora kikuchii TaxID=84275 RepID=A0A9P3FBB3_9PEZI|nr:uncharacterized protein CKM354_000424300 [Cercospora kikuchii]GIZ40923.1 hypothetical protein CKM354_000424300 [Cercospora kikuchii]
MAASGGTTHATTPVPDDTRVHGAASDLRKRVAIPKIIGVFPKSAKKSTRSITSLLEGSTEDDTSECAQYQGPPIGYSSVDVVHKDGYKEVVGSLYAPRPRFGTVDCRRRVCGHCFRVHYQPEFESIVDTGSDDPSPWTFKSGPPPPGFTHSLHHLGYLHFPTKLPPLSGLAVTPAPAPAPAPPPQTPQHHHHNKTNSLSATAPTFIPSSSTASSTPSTAHVKAQLAAREAAAKAIIAAVHNNTPPSDSKPVPTGPANSAYGSRFNHSTGLVFGPKSIDLRSPAQKSNDRKNRTRVVSGAPTAPAAMRERGASAASSPSIDGGGFVAAGGSPLLSGEASPRIGVGGGGEAGGSQKRTRRGKGKGNGNVRVGVERQEFWMR